MINDLVRNKKYMFFYLQYLLGIGGGESKIFYQFTRILDYFEGFYLIHLPHILFKIEILEMTMVSLDEKKKQKTKTVIPL